MVGGTRHDESEIEPKALEIVQDSSLLLEGECDVSLTEDDFLLQHAAGFSVIQPARLDAPVVIKKAELRKNPTNAEIKLVVAKAASKDRLLAVPPPVKSALSSASIAAAPAYAAAHRTVLSDVLKNATASCKELSIAIGSRESLPGPAESVSGSAEPRAADAAPVSAPASPRGRSEAPLSPPAAGGGRKQSSNPQSPRKASEAVALSPRKQSSNPQSPRRVSEAAPLSPRRSSQSTEAGSQHDSPSSSPKGWRKFIPNVLRKHSLSTTEEEPPVVPPRPESTLSPRRSTATGESSNPDMEHYVQPNAKLDLSIESILEVDETPHTYVELRCSSMEEQALALGAAGVCAAPAGATESSSVPAASA